MIILGYLIFVIPLSMLRGWATVKLWGWFVAPVFHVPELTLVPAMGISLLVSFLTTQLHTDTDEKKTDAEKFGRDLIYSIFIPLMGVGFGWLYHQFM